MSDEHDPSLNGTERHGTALNGAIVNGASMNGVSLNGAAAAPAHQLAHDLATNERARLMAEIAAANDRAAAARARTAQIQAEVQADLRMELEASRATVEAMEREHLLALAAIRDRAQAEVDRILTAARLQAASPADLETRNG
jgi:hypothetical protein